MDKKTIEEIIEHAKQEYPKEACGILVKKKNCIEIYKMKNISENPTNCYLTDPEEQFALFKKLEEENNEIFAIYHSHTHIDAYPSARDIELAFYPNALHIIISLKNFQRPEIRMFKIYYNSEKLTKEDVLNLEVFKKLKVEEVKNA